MPRITAEFLGQLQASGELLEDIVYWGLGHSIDRADDALAQLATAINSEIERQEQEDA